MRNKLVFQGGTVVLPDRTVNACLVVEDGVVSGLTLAPPPGGYEVVDVSGKLLLPGVIDTHVHLSEPSPNSHRENWYTGSRSAAAGGVTTIVQMPITDPTLVDTATFRLAKGLAEEKSCVDFALWGGLTPACVDAFPEMDALGCVAYKGFMAFAGEFYPHIGDADLMRAMETAAKFGGLIGVHAENAELALRGAAALEREGCRDYGRYDEARPWWVEAEAISRALLFARASGARLYVCHLSGAEGVQLIKEAKARRMDVSAETCPHYLLFTRELYREKENYAKCDPPLRSAENREKLWEYAFDGTLDTLGSDHGLYRDQDQVPEGSFWSDLSGFGSIDVGFTAFFSEALERGLPLQRMAQLASGNAARILGLSPRKGSLLPGSDGDVLVLDPDCPWQYDGTRSFSGVKSDKGPYHGRTLRCKVLQTYIRGRLVYDGDQITAPAGWGRYVPRTRGREGVYPPVED